VALLFRFLAIAAVVAVAPGCDGDDAPGATPSATATATPPPTATPDPELVTLEGPIVVLNRYADGHPRQLGMAVEPRPETVWTTGGKELVYFWDSPVARELLDRVGRNATVRGRLERGNAGQHTVVVHSYEVDGELVEAVPVAPVSIRDVVEGTVDVLDRYADGHPRRIGIRPDGGTAITLDDANKSRELRFRIGRRMRIHGAIDDATGVMSVAAYEELDGNPLVEAGDGFRLSFLAGALDVDGNFMGGVEIDTIAAFDGKVFAGVSYRQNSDLDSVDPPPPGAQVLVLDRPDGRWRVDLTVDAAEAGPAPRFVSLKQVSFATDASGKSLDPPVTFLAAVGGNGELYLRSPGKPVSWVATGLPERLRANATTQGRRTDARSVIAHTDRVTGISHVFVGAFLSGRRGDGAGIYRGSYDPALPSRIRWADAPEFPFTATAAEPWRVMGLTEANGVAYASIGKLLLRREDGPEGTWTEIYRDPLPSGRDSLREAAGVASPNGPVSLLAGIEGPNSRVVRVDAVSGAALDELLPLQDLGPAIYGIIAYNGPEPVVVEEGGVAIAMGMEILRIRGDFGLGIQDPDLGRVYEWTDGLMLWREPDGGYSLNRVHDRSLEVHPPLVGPRAILGRSPFDGEEDVVYIGGFDHNGHPFHNTAWIFKVHVDDLREGLLQMR
jgi:hypothetical protein